MPPVDRNPTSYLVSLTNLKSFFMQSYAPYFTQCTNLTIEGLVPRNPRLRELTLQALHDLDTFTLDPLAKYSGNLKHLTYLDIEGARFSDASRGKPMQGLNLEQLHCLTIRHISSSLEIDLKTLRKISTLSNPCLASLRISCYDFHFHEFEKITALLFSPSQCDVVFGRLHSLRIEGGHNTKHWLEWIAPHCSRLKVVALGTEVLLSRNTLSVIPATIQSFSLRVTDARWWEIEEVCSWMKCILELFSSKYFSELKVFSLSLSGELVERFGDHTSQQEDAHVLLNRIQEFEESMRSLC